MTSPEQGYALGHAEEELERLDTQARLIDPITRRFLHEAGLRAGMRVLDVGCGAGDTSLLIAGMVGEGGEVVGVDRAGVAIAVARSRASAANLRFFEGDPSEMSFEQPFDAVVGRYVLMWNADPAAMLRALVRHLRPGGLIFFHELAAGGLSSSPPLPTFDRVMRWNVEATRLSGADPDMGVKLYAAFATAGLPGPTLRAETLSGRGADSRDLMVLARNLTRSLLPAMEQHGVATPAEIELETLFEQLVEEAVQLDGVVVWPLQVGVWSRL